MAQTKVREYASLIPKSNLNISVPLEFARGGHSYLIFRPATSARMGQLPPHASSLNFPSTSRALQRWSLAWLPCCRYSLPRYKQFICLTLANRTPTRRPTLKNAQAMQHLSAGDSMLRNKIDVLFRWCLKANQHESVTYQLPQPGSSLDVNIDFSEENRAA